MQSHSFSSFDGTRIETVFLPGPHPESPTIIWVHGAFEHSGRYEEVMRHFQQHGFASICYDQRGHGRSGGTRCYINNLEDYLKDLTAVYHHYLDKINEKLFLVGHSMGGLVVTRHRQLFADAIPVTAAIVSSPFLGIGAPIPAWKRNLSKAVVAVYPKFAVPNDLDSSVISHDPKVVAAYVNDPLVLKKATAGWFEAIQRSLREVHAYAGQTPGPYHILMATEDKLVDPKQTRAFYQHLSPSIDKSFQEFEGFYHEIFNEVEKEKAWNALEQLLARY
jgi:lysophospholipase